MSKYALVEIEDDASNCKVNLFETEKLAIEVLKKRILKDIANIELEQNIKMAKTYKELEKVTDYFEWGENNIRLYWIVKI